MNSVPTLATTHEKMAEDIIIDKATFFNRLSSFYAAWKSDKRPGNGVFGGVGSIVVLMGKTDEANSFQKNNAMHVCWLLILAMSGALRF